MKAGPSSTASRFPRDASEILPLALSYSLMLGRTRSGGAARPRGLSLNMVFLMALRRMGRDDITAHGFRS